MPKPNWPKRGIVVFDGVTAAYTENGEPRLKNVSFRTQAGEKIGVVGRTGAGKARHASLTVG